MKMIYIGIILYLINIIYSNKKRILELEKKIYDINILYLYKDEEYCNLKERYDKNINIKEQLEKAFKKRNKKK